MQEFQWGQSRDPLKHLVAGFNSSMNILLFMYYLIFYWSVTYRQGCLIYMLLLHLHILRWIHVWFLHHAFCLPIYVNCILVYITDNLSLAILWIRVGWFLDLDNLNIWLVCEDLLNFPRPIQELLTVAWCDALAEGAGNRAVCGRGHFFVRLAHAVSTKLLSYTYPRNFSSHHLCPSAKSF